MIRIPIDQISQSDIESFFNANRVGESTFDYKMELGDLSTKAQDKNELLKDITSFANAEGGDLIIGVSQSTNDIQGIQIADGQQDVLISQVENIILGNVTPRLPSNPQIRFIPLKNGNKVLMIRVHKSHIGPHRIYREGKDFWTRGVNGKFSLDVPQLRRIFGERERVQDDISRFILNRTSNILAGTSTFNLPFGKSTVILHIIPVQDFAEQSRRDFASLHEPVKKLVPLESDTAQTTIVNFNGVASYSTMDGFVSTYSQAFYSGAIECVNSNMLSFDLHMGGVSSRPFFLADHFAITLFKDLPVLLEYLDLVGVDYPVSFHLQFHNVKGLHFARTTEDSYLIAQARVLKESSLLFPELVLQQKPLSFPSALRPWIDLAWRAFGFTGCSKYREDGAYVEAPGPGPQGRIWK